MTLKPFPPLDAAIGTIMLQIMGELSHSDVPEDTVNLLNAMVRNIKELWPDECIKAKERTKFVPGKEEFSTRPMYDDVEGWM